MSIDMSQFYQVFFEESQEHLDSMESLLLGLDLADPDAEELNAIFRAAHSIKGSAGTFGFTDLAEVTHVLENLLDRIRKGELALRPEMIDAFLDAGDVLKGLLAAHRGNGEADPAQVAAMCKRLSELTVSGSPVAASPAPEAAGGPAIVAAPTGEMEASFVLELEADDAARTVENLVAELSEACVVSVFSRPTAADQPWVLRLAADADTEIVRGLLEFVARSDSIRIGPAGSIARVAGDSAGAYGFFDEPSAPASVATDDAWGLFNDAPTPAADAPQAVAPAADDSFGFFVDLPAPDTAVAASPAPTLAAGSEGDGFGFFVDVPAPGAAAASASSVVTAAAPEAAVAPAKPVADRRATPRTGGGETSIRVDVDKVDQLINLIGELVITQAMLAQSASELDPVRFERLHNGLTQLERNTRDMQESVMSIRMMPISVVFSRFPRVVRDLAQKLGKQIELKTIGEGTELDKSLIERISDPLTHLVRNSLDHGVEMPEDRIAKGKSPTGTITLKAYHQSGNIVIEVGDDGAGLNRQKIMSKAREKGIAVHDQMTDGEVWLLIFEPGFSTADVVTEVSGRGVGMDVVKRNISAMGGRVEIESMTGIGTRMTVRLPLTLAILDGMSVAAGKETYIIPLGYVIESLQAERGMIKSVSGVERLIQVRDEYLPVVALYEVFGIPNTITRLDQGIMVVLEADGVKAALFIDALVGQHQVVIKSLESNYRKVPGISGATIMGDGHVALILDVVALVQMAKSALPEAA
ncbi:MAG: chemotaxis protein CheW [Rhodocyclales bacterium]|jgi:two-component system chemotaxis sensor kinase CheA|nr:chemotaxis protein CheW [Rhodocyclales bacterium]